MHGEKFCVQLAGKPIEKAENREWIDKKLHEHHLPALKDGTCADAGCKHKGPMEQDKHHMHWTMWVC